VKKPKITTPEMEIALACWLNYRQNLIVPNVYWGFGPDMHECDLVMLSRAGYVTEIEIKVTRQDLRKDRFKAHGHRNIRIKYLYFAIPTYLEPAIEFIPERAGVISVEPDRKDGYGPRCKRIRAPERQKSARKATDKERYQLARLGALRIWNLKRIIHEN